MAACKEHLRDAQTAKAGSGVFKLRKGAGVVRGASGACRRSFVDVVSGVVLAGSACGMYSAAGLTMQIAAADMAMQITVVDVITKIAAADMLIQTAMLGAAARTAAVGLKARLAAADRTLVL